MSNEKSLYFSQNFVVKTMTIMSDITNSILLASDNSPSGGPINHVNIVKACMNGITLLGHVLSEFEALCGTKPGSAGYKAKTTNTRSKYLLDDNLKQAAKDAKRLEEITKKNSYRKEFKV